MKTLDFEDDVSEPAHHGETQSMSSGSRASARHAKHKNGPQHSETWFFTRDTFVYCVVLFIVLFLLFGNYRIPSGSMEDTIEIGDRIVVTKLAPNIIKPQRGDVVVFKDPAHWLGQKDESPLTDTLVKRLIGLPGDIVACQGKGFPVTINGEPIDETAYIKSGVNPSDFPFEVKVTPGNVFVMGDNRANSADSRWHANDGNNGLVPIHDIRGKGLLTLWPLNRFGALKSHHEVFDHVRSAG